jgi:S-adenosylmethionine synthetase
MASWHFTSESVTEGHPDKVADRISDSVVDALLAEDADARVACEVLVTSEPGDASNAVVGRAVVGGEVRASGSTVDNLDVESIVRRAVHEIGYEDPADGFSADLLRVTNLLHGQSEDIAMGVDRGDWRTDPDLLGAGDQGLMFGYACDETDVLMPLPIQTAHRLARGLADLRHSGTLPWLRPDGKTQVIVRYEDGVAKEVSRVLVSTQHDEDIDQGDLADALRAHLPAYVDPGLIDDAEWFVNPTGRFVIGGPHGDAGLTGRKIIVDTYGGAAPHGGGAFSGKDPTKVDRSASYAARWVAKHVVGAGLATSCQVQVAYAIGRAEPFSMFVDTFGTEVVAHERILGAVREVFDLRPGAILRDLDLTRPIYTPTSSYGHFGRPEFPWESLDRIGELRAAAGA